MAIFAIADLHLSLGTDKPMGVFGSHWEHHEEKISSAWRELIRPTDTVLIPGDISWAMTLPEALPDLRFLHELPGTKILSKGNHDYWWGTNGKVEAFLAENGLHTLRLLKNNAYLIEGRAVCGSRGWILPQDPAFTASDRTIYERELMRLTRSLEAGARLAKESGGDILALVHYPPLPASGADTDFTRCIEAFEVSLCIYGHLHGRGHKSAFEGVKNHVRYQLVAGDYIAFKPLRL